MQFDLVIKNGTLVEPSLDRVTVGNIGISGSKIAAVTRQDIAGARIIDANLKVVSPGFVDPHSHTDNFLYGGRCMVLQGVTTAISGNCGLNTLPPKNFFQQMEEQGYPINQGLLVGHSFSLREEAGVTDVYSPASEEQISKMVFLAEERLGQGALGISFGLEYSPGASYKEAIALCEVAARYGKPIAIHTRTDSWEGLKAINEAIQFNRDTGVAVHISHLAYMVGMGMMTEALTLIEGATRQGLDITADSGLYSAFATFIGSAVFDPGCLEKWGCDYGSFYVSTGSHANQRCDKGLFDKLREEEPDTVIVAFVGHEHEVIEALLKPFVMVSTDAPVGTPEPGTGHPQQSGTYPKFLKYMVRESGSLTLLEAVKKCTILPAQRFGLKSKGSIRPGYDADIAIFDLDKICDRSDYPGLGIPDAPPEGIDYVIVNGCVVVDQGSFREDVLPGKPVVKPNDYWLML